MTYASGVSVWEAYLPGIAIILLLVAVLPWLDRNNTAVRGALIGLCLVVAWRYVIWRLTCTLPPLGFTPDFAVGLLFAVVEMLSILGGSLSLFFLTRVKNRSAEADANLAWLAALPRAPLVDVLICTYNEDETILERTIGARAIEHPNTRVWVCDDGRRPWLKALAEYHGCGYLTRPDNAHAKAGNINSALRHLAQLGTPPDFISILDADFVAKPKLVQRALSLMKDDDVGVVQTPQHFFNPDPIQSNLSTTNVWPDEQRYFFDVVMASKDAWGGAFCCGTSSLIRFKPLIEIGGFPTDSVTEDYLVTIRLKEIGFRTVYLNERLSVGLAPEGLKEYITQRSRWALGFIQICRGRSGPFSTTTRISLLDRFMLIETLLHWTATYYFRVLGLVVPSLYLLFDVQAVYANLSDAISYVFPFIVTQLGIMMWMTRGRVLPIMADMSQLLSAQEISRAVTIGHDKPKGHKFKVTAKGGDRCSSFIQWSMLRGFLFFAGMSLAGIIWAFAFDDSRPLADSSAMALFWSWYNLVILSLASFVCVEASQRRGGDRFSSDEWAMIGIAGREVRLRVRDISASGMRVISDATVRTGTVISLRLGQIVTEAKVVRQFDDGFAIHFEASAFEREAIIRHVYCGAYNSTVERIKPAQVALAVFGRVFR